MSRFAPLQEQAMLAFQLVSSYFLQKRVTTEDMQHFEDDLSVPRNLETELHMWDVNIIWCLTPICSPF